MSFPRISTYRYDNTTVRLTYDADKRLRATVESKDLSCHSVSTQEEDPREFTWIQDLYSNPLAMQTYADGKTKDQQFVAKRINDLVQREKDGIPFHGFLVSKKISEEGEKRSVWLQVQPVAFAVIGFGRNPDGVELSLIVHPDYHKQGVDTKLISMMYVYVAALRQAQFTLRGGSPINRITATCGVENVPTNHILENEGFQRISTIQQHGCPKHLWELKLSSGQPAEHGRWEE